MTAGIVQSPALQMSAPFEGIGGAMRVVDATAVVHIEGVNHVLTARTYIRADVEVTPRLSQSDEGAWTLTLVDSAGVVVAAALQAPSPKVDDFERDCDCGCCDEWGEDA